MSMTFRRPLFLAFTILFALALFQVPALADKNKKKKQGGSKVQVEGFILAVEKDRILVENTWFLLTDKTMYHRRGDAFLTANDLQLGWEVSVRGKKAKGAEYPVAKRITVKTNKNRKVKLVGFLEISGQRWDDFSVPEIHWSENQTDESLDDEDSEDDEEGEGFNDLREHDLEIRGRSIEFTEKAEFYGRGYVTIPYRILYPGILVDVDGHMDEEKNCVLVDSVHARYERPDPLEYQIRQESALEIRKLKPGIWIYTDPGLDRWLEQIGSRLIPPYAHLPRETPKFRFEILASEEPVSFAMPDGSIYISAGLLALLRSEDEVAAVLAHEISHICLRHFLRAIEKKQHISFIDLGTFAGTIAFGPLVSVLGPMLKVATYKGLRVVPFAILHGYQNKLEYEADAYAADFLQHAGYHPGALFSVHDMLDAFGADPGAHADPALPFFWLNEQRWEKRMAHLRAECIERFPDALNYEAKTDPEYRKRIENLILFLKDKIEKQEEKSPFADRLLEHLEQESE
ncbi:M48 family metallopeptidase [Acidobacteriota bacterium]